LPTRDIRLEKASHTSKQLGSNNRGCAAVAGRGAVFLEKADRTFGAAAVA
jgi:hypothetical protein